VQRFLIIPVILSAVLSFASCGKEAEYGACFMPDDMQKECEQLQLDKQCNDLGIKCKASCLIGDHPECHNNPCLLYNYEDTTTGNQAISPPFCTKKCQPDNPKGKDPTSATCGADARCMPFLDDNYCIPIEYISPSGN